ncbi:MAG: CPBP family intramembrane glutamic endopeptidase, partial [Myxococcota bacterium]
AAAGAAELATIIAVGESAGYDHPGAALALIGLQDVLVYGYVDVRIERSLAARELYAPQDSLGDLLAAPFNRRVLARSDVWAGTLILVAAGVGASLLLDGGDIERDEIASRPNVFGHEFHPGLGYPLGLGAFGLLFSHVAVAEEALFRGELQSAIARTRSPEAGWLWASLLFGATHSLNALFLPADERTRYLLLGVPFITAVGSYIGHTYRRSEYSLAVPVAIHFWYDVLLSATFFALDPKNSPLSAGVRLHF